MTPKIIALPSVVVGDTWPGFTYALASPTTEFADTLASCRMFFDDSNGVTQLQLTSASGITITNAATWALTVAAITPFPLAAGSYKASIETTSSAGRIRTYSQFTLAVLDDPT